MAKRLTKLRVDEVSVVDKAANGKRFLILKRADPEAAPLPAEDPGDGGVGAWVKGAIQKAAGIPGPEDGGQEMTAEDITKAVQEAAEAALAPLMERVDELEAAFAVGVELESDVTAEPETDSEPAPETDEPETLEPEGLTAEAVAKVVSEAVAAQIEPLASRLEVVENVAGVRKSGTPESAHPVRTSDTEWTWQGQGVL